MRWIQTSSAVKVSRWMEEAGTTASVARATSATKTSVGSECTNSCWEFYTRTACGSLEHNLNHQNTSLLEIFLYTWSIFLPIVFVIVIYSSIFIYKSEILPYEQYQS